MSARSSLRSLLLLAAVAACSKKGAPEADPAQVKARAQAMILNTPAPAAAKACTPEQLKAPGITARSLILMAGNEMPETHERADWINPWELEDPAVRLYLDATDESAKRQAAAKVLGLPAFIVWRPENVDVPLAIGVKELKRGVLGMRAIGYDNAGNVTCLTVFSVLNDKEVSEWAQVQSDKAVIDPAVAKALQHDLRQRLRGKVAAMQAGQEP
jgi:hypothetical protein